MALIFAEILMIKIMEAKKHYRPGPLGGLMDEYERTLKELQQLLSKISEEDYVRISDPVTADPDCRSVQTILSHVISSGYGYATYIRDALEIKTARPKIPLLPKAKAIGGLDEMFGYSLETFEGRWDMDEEKMLTTVFKTHWSEYDIESMLEHAIVHILRHRRQIEKLMMR